MSRHSEKSFIKGTSVSVTKFGLGSAPSAGLYTPVSEEECAALFKRVLESGIRYFDTAPLYAHGLGELRVGRGIKSMSDEVVISTKVGRLLREGVNNELDKWPNSDPNIDVYFDTSTDGIMKSLEASLKRLGRDYIEIALIHDAYTWLEEAIDVVFPLLADLRSQGVIKAVGIGMNYCEPSIKIMKNTDLNVALMAGRYTLLDQSAAEELLPLAVEKNVSIVAAGVFNSGILANPVTGAYFDYEPASDEMLNKARKIAAFLKERDISLTSAALQFPLSHPAVTTVLVGIRSITELDANLEAFDQDLPADLWTDLRSAGLIS